MPTEHELGVATAGVGRPKRTLLVLSTLALAVGCGGESAGDADNGSNDTTSSPTNTSTMDGSGGSTVSSTSEASSASTGGATSGSTSGGSTTGGPGLDCSGDFGEPVLLFTGDVTAPQSFTLTPDELEIFYVDYPDGVRIIQRRLRSSRSASFGPAETVPELLDVCPSLSAELAVGTVDLSPDGLTAYICCEEDVSLPTTLVTATRTALGSPFTPDLTSLGNVGASFATADGLEAFANTPGPLDQLERYHRTSLTVPFGASELASIELRGPDPSNDGLWLFGSVLTLGSEAGEYRLAAAARADLSAPFEEPAVAGLPAPPAGFSDLTPTISADCRSLYFLRFGTTAYSVMVTQR